MYINIHVKFMFLDPQVPVIVNFGRPTGGLNRNLSLGSLVPLGSLEPVMCCHSD